MTKKKTDRKRASSDASFPVVGIGASAGGLESFKKLLQVMPTDTGIAFVLIQHLDPDHESLMADLLSKYTDMPVHEVQDGMEMSPNHVYMIPPNKYMKVVDGGLFLEAAVKRRGSRMAIDHFFRSLAEAKREAAICIVLSGTGTDGTLGLKEVKALGGMAIVQSPDTAEYDGMPRSAVATGLVDFVLPINEIPEVIAKYVRHPYVDRGAKGASLEETAPDHLQSIVNVLRAHTDYDFRSYKKATLNRRIQRRMSLRHMQSVTEYLKLLRQDSEEVRALFKDLLIGVTRFFRDKEAWAALADQVVVPIVRERERGKPIRLWVPACATGEEALSLAMLFLEEIEKQRKNIDVQVFATDLDEESIDRGRFGVYPASISGDVGASRLKRFFIEEDDGYRLKKSLRESVVFAVQNLIVDPPFSHLDLICCRNALIYLEPDFQQKLIELFHFALRAEGFLFLGSAESVNNRKLFTAVDQSCRIYRKRGVSARGAMTFPVTAPTPRAPSSEEIAAVASGARVIEAAKQTLLDTYAPASVVIGSDREVRYYQGRLRDFLDLPQGEPTQDLLAMVAEGSKNKLRGLLQKALHEKKKVEAVVPGRAGDDGSGSLRLVVQPLPRIKGSEPTFLVSFVEEATAPSTPARGKRGGGKEKEEKSAQEESLLEQVQYELDATRQDLQSTIEELETSNEELKASNEEVMSMNEELQSTNEELETSREELQSLNEELSTVNNELEDKVVLLESTNDDLRNLLDSTDIATIFLDTDMRIRRFTPATTELLNVIDSDVGRPVSDLAPRVHDPDLLVDAHEVKKRLQPLEKEVRGTYAWFLRRILPYRTSENRIDGVVVTFTEITKLKETSRRLEARESQQAAVASLGRIALTAQSLQELFDQAVVKVQETLDIELAKVLRLSPDESELLLVAGVGWNEGFVGEATVPAGIDSQAGYTLSSRTPVVVEELASEKRFSGPALLTDHDVVSGVSAIIGSPERPWGVIGAHSTRRVEFSVDDVNFLQSVAHLLGEAIARRGVEHQLRKARHRLQTIADSVPVLIAYVDHRGVFEFNNAPYESMFGIPREKLRGVHIRDALGEDVYQTVEPFLKRALAGEAVSFERTHRRADGEMRDLFVSYTPGDGEPDELGGIAIAIVDVTDVKKAEESLRLSQDAGGVGSWDWDVKTGLIECTEKYFRIYGLPPRKEFSYTDWLSQVHADDRQDVEMKLSRALAGDAGFDTEFRIIRPDGEERWVSAKGRVYFDDQGKPLRMLGVNSDVTDNKLLELGLRKARVELEKASQLKDEFLALLGHELRNPLGAIANGVQLLRSDGSSEHRAWAEEMLERQVGHLGRLVDDLLDLTRITRGQIEIRRRRVDLRSLVEESVGSLRDLLESTDQKVDISVPEEEIFLHADPARIEQVLINLLTNAVKYGEMADAERPEPIELEITATESEAVIRVADKGIGILSNDLELIFEPFVRVSEKLDRAGSGLGIGLTLVRKLVELHHGSVTASSEGAGKGSEFVVRLPLCDPSDMDDDANGEDAEILVPAGELKVLVIDDNRDLAEGLRKRLAAMGHEVEVAYEGVEGISRAREFRPRAVLVDVGLPGLDGYQVAEKLRSGVPGPLWIAAISGYKQDEERERSAKLFDHYFVKPVDMDELGKSLPRPAANGPRAS